MDINISNNEECNCYEFFLVKNNDMNSDELDIYNCNFSIEEFYTLLNKINDVMHKLSIKSHQKEWKEYINGDMFYKNYSNNGIRVYKKIYVDVKELTPDWIFTKSIKTKQSPLNYSCNAQDFSSLYIRCITYRINNRIFINFENCWNSKIDKIYYKIYINYNHDNCVDISLIKDKIVEIINLFLNTTC